MGLFSKYRPNYLNPERFSPEEARERRLTAMLERERRFSELPNFQVKLDEVRRKAALSRVTKNILNEDAERLVKVRKQSGPKAASIAAALKMFTERDFADPQLRSAYRELRRRQGGQQNVVPSGSDKRRYNPTGKDFASTIYGTLARLSGVPHALHSARWQAQFLNPTKVIPCIQRTVRKEVMFAKKHAGKGYRTPKRRTWASGVPC